MKRYLFSAFLGFWSATAAAEGYYRPIPYYGNDPFTFCTYGVPQDCWYPISKELGIYGVSNWYCFNIASAELFAEVCPKAFPMSSVSAGDRQRLPAKTH